MSIHSNFQVASGQVLADSFTIGYVASQDWLAGAGWLSDDILLLIRDQPSPALAPRAAWLEHAGSKTDLNARRFGIAPGYPAPDIDLIALGLPESGIADRCELVLADDDQTLRIDWFDLTHRAGDHRTLAREWLAQLPAATRSELLSFLAAFPGLARSRSSRRRRSQALFALREALRERLPSTVVAPEVSYGLGVDALLALDERSFFISGWLWDEDDLARSLVAISPEGSRVELLAGHLFRYPRRDIEQAYGATGETHDNPTPGFMAYFELDAPSLLPSGWTVELRIGRVSGCEAVAPPVIQDPKAVRDRLLGELVHERLPGATLRRQHILPAMTRVQERNRRAAAMTEVVQFGAPAPNPAVSIVIPLYQRIDFLEHQMAQFVHDPQLADNDIIYVLDSPELADDLLQRAEQIAELYQIPFRVAVLNRNVGFAEANNLAAAIARGRLLLLMNSDVIPARPGWLATLVAFYDATPGIGALGPKLLYEDDSLQHAGLYFEKSARSRLWENLHFFKGLQRQLPSANQARPVPAVTGACLLIDRDLYLRLGGLHGTYVQGDFEDSDLCLRLIQAGHENWYLPAAELYHLEGQSYPSELRQLAYRFNAWLHTHQWDDLIRSVMSNYPGLGCRAQPAGGKS